LVQEGIVRLDDPVRKFVEEFPPSEPPLTIRHLVTHTSGLPHPQRERTPQLYATHYDDVVDAMEVFRDVRRLGDPGSVFRYSSSNYNLLAIVIQRAADRKFQEYVRATLFDPLDMSETAFDDVRHVMPNRTRRYAYLDPWTYRRSVELQRIPGRWDYSFNTGGGNVISTALDLVKLGNAFVTPGVFSRAALDSVYHPISTGGPDSPWSYGWFAGEDHGRRRIHMTGANPGVQAGLVVYPDDEVVVAVLSNAWGHDARSAEMVNVRRFAAMCMGWPDP
jgi:CubicO group peptidase (beta-lactamase class C family)